ncbi:cyclic nucleotide-binding domain-containing protein [Xanthomonas cerealis pv. cerealis]|uniref:CRP-like protein Clp n=1 Tax=Xanthomonas cerealis pv. cerealis TaxID=152263 RepID=A0A514EIM9_9XANT|nr:helix-turn-helix domain-containing protein [Xanthomonas translucens]QDI05781.1 cyclic nucleotide-binding domain-containing protein [Xanthomonas translucens pv. cerealis]
MHRTIPGFALPYVEPTAARDPNAHECMHCAVRHLAICSALAYDEVQALERVTTSLSYAAGATVVRTGEARQFVYTVVSGALRLVRTLADGRRQVVGFVLPGDYVGLSESTKYRNDIETIADTRACRVSVAHMRQLREQYPQLERKLLQRACLELDAAQDAALSLARLQPMEKLADFLLKLAARTASQGDAGNTVTLMMGRGDIADHLGLTMETVSRSFTKLRQQGLIALPQLHVVEIRDFAALHRLASVEGRQPA